ncbi:MAG: hypothetical protein ACFB0F_17550, partial [Neomegalonema sp.]
LPALKAGGKAFVIWRRRWGRIPLDRDVCHFCVSLSLLVTSRLLFPFVSGKRWSLQHARVVA